MTSRFSLQVVWRLTLSLFVASLSLCQSRLVSLAALPIEAPELVLKAATIYNVAVFVEWPRNRFADKNSPVIIGVLANDALAEGLEAISRSGQKIGPRDFKVLRVKPGDNFNQCHVLVVGGNREFDAILDPAQLGGILTIGEQPLFGERGGMVNLVVENKLIRLDVNKGAVDKAGLVVSSKLLNLKLVRKVIQPQSGRKTR